MERFVEFQGILNPYELAYEYNRANIYISLSLIDGNNISLNEAMASDVFTICSNTPASRQWFVHKQNGLIIKNNYSHSELAELIASFDSRSELVRNAEKLGIVKKV